MWVLLARFDEPDPPPLREVVMSSNAFLPPVVVRALATIVPVIAFVGCAAPSTAEDSSASEAPLSSSEHLEKSRIDVAAKITKTHDVSGMCAIDKTHVRITYDNSTLPSGTKITLHIGESRYDQYFIGDGFGWSDGRKVEWMNLRDLPMTATGDTWTVETDVDGYGRIHNNPDLGFVSEPLGAELQFVFRLELPGGRVVWDDRLHQNYEASMNYKMCPGYIDLAPLASWGPF
jgi:hypothetical protein